MKMITINGNLSEYTSFVEKLGFIFSRILGIGSCVPPERIVFFLSPSLFTDGSMGGEE